MGLLSFFMYKHGCKPRSVGICGPDKSGCISNSNWICTSKNEFTMKWDASAVFLMSNTWIKTGFDMIKQYCFARPNPRHLKHPIVGT